MPTRLYFKSASADTQIGYSFTNLNLEPTGAYFWRTLELSPTSGSTSTAIARSTELGPLIYPLELRVNPNIYYEWVSPPVDRVSSSRYVMIPQNQSGEYRRGGAAFFGNSPTTRFFINKNASRAYILDPFGFGGLGASRLIVYTSSYDGMINDLTTNLDAPPYSVVKDINVSQTPNYGFAAAVSNNDNVIFLGSDTIDAETGRLTVRAAYAPDYTQQKTITSSFTENYGFGYGGSLRSVLDCSADGTKLFVGEPDVPSGSNMGIGIVNFFTGSNFEIHRIITASYDMFPSESVTLINFGGDVKCSSDGNILAVGAVGASGSYGQVYIYTGSNYNLVKTLSSSADVSVALQNSFGFPIEMSDDGSVIIVGDYKNNRVHVYSGSNWQFRKILTASVSSSYSGLVLEEALEDFGYSLDCSSDGKTIFVGSPNATVENAFAEGSPLLSSGRIHLFTGSNWSTNTVYTSSTAFTSEQFFGSSIAVTRDTLDEVHIKGNAPYIHTLTKRGWIDDTIQLNICANQSANGANSTIGVRLDVINTLLNSNLFLTEYVKFPAELGNTNAKRIFTSSVRSDDGIFGTPGTPGPVFLHRGQRIRAILATMDAPGQTMGAGQTTTFTFNGSTATTDSNIFFSESITFMTTSSSPAVLYMTSVENDVTSSSTPAGDWNAAFPLTSSNLTASVRQYGHSLATSADGNLLAVGAYLASALSGAAYVYQSSSLTNIRNPQRMQFVKELKASDSQSRHRDYFGYSIDVAKDKSTIVVGAPNAIAGNISGSGKLYVYSGSNWNVEQIISSSNIIVSGNFGHSVRCSQDGNIIVVGAPNEVNPTNTGSVYVISGSSRNTITRLTGSVDGGSWQMFGNALAISYDGSTIVVGAPSASFTTQSQGAVYIYTGSNWQTRYLITESLSDRDRYFGYSVDCSADGKNVIVGSPGNVEDTGSTFLGNVYLYTHQNWSSALRILPVIETFQDPNLLTRYGHKVSCTADALIVYSSGKFCATPTVVTLFTGSLDNSISSGSSLLIKPSDFYNVGDFIAPDTYGTSFLYFRGTNESLFPTPNINSSSLVGADIACASNGLPFFVGIPQNPIAPAPYKEWVYPYVNVPLFGDPYINILSASRA